ncbi:hypothetical protein [Flammeovirga sp. SJP92]|uniref:tetratricopeptide repeat protein n=1 Tax=Flammeovirga sp. SJP92 TaxID=1775430 RepID=UPI000786D66B|nr:hypothetical protein [Flammeovirga sp. SJP92]KXX72559.1 hypothetical protein AVL50_00375 [Flammeovirga sp. SJP92]
MKNLLLLFLFLTSNAVFAQEKNPIELFFKNAEKFRVAKDYHRAIVEYEQAISLADTVAKVHYWKGVCNLMIKDTTRALEDWQKVIALDNNYLPVYPALSKVYQNQKSYTQYKKNVDQWLLIEKDPIKKINLCVETANFFFYQDRFQDARIYSQNALKIAPDNTESLYLDAQITNNLGKYTESIATIDKILSQFPENAPINQTAKYYYEKGMAYYLMEDYNNAMPILNKADVGPYKPFITKLKPDYFFAVASAYEDIYNFEQAKTMLEKAMKIDPTYIKANILLADIIVREEHHHKGIHLFELGLKDYKGFDKLYLKAYDQFIDILICSQKYEKALKYADECLANFQGARNILYYKLVAQYKLGKREDAINTGLNLLSNSNVSPQEFVKYSLLMGYIYNKQNFPKCIQSFQDARKGPYFPAATYSIESFNSENEGGAQL